uniref:Predicted protein n=1 Tax=Physcomitrium patens TaxID=3218 RepID=A9U2M4_PHYPA
MATKQDSKSSYRRNCGRNPWCQPYLAKAKQVNEDLTKDHFDVWVRFDSPFKVKHAGFERNCLCKSCGAAGFARGFGTNPTASSWRPSCRRVSPPPSPQKLGNLLGCLLSWTWRCQSLLTGLSKVRKLQAWVFLYLGGEREAEGSELMSWGW